MYSQTIKFLFDKKFYLAGKNRKVFFLRFQSFIYSLSQMGFGHKLDIAIWAPSV